MRRTALFLLFILSWALKGQNVYVANDLGEIYKVDINTGTSTLLVATNPFFVLTDIAFDRYGELYALSGFGQIGIVDTVSGNISPITTLPASPFFDGYVALTADADGIFYIGESGGQILSYDSSTNQTQSFGNVGDLIAGDLTFYNDDIIVSLKNPDLLARIDTSAPISYTTIASMVGGQSNSAYGFSSMSDNCGNTRTFLTVDDIDKDGTAVLYEWAWPGYVFVCPLPGDAVGMATRTEYLTSVSKLTLENATVSSSCGRGTIVAEAQGGIPPYTYFLSNGPVQDSATFTDVATGIYTVFVEDSLGCLDSVKLEVVNDERLEVIVDEFIDPTCSEGNGRLAFSAQGGSGTLEYSINGVDFFLSGFFDDLFPVFMICWFKMRLDAQIVFRWN